MTSNPFSDDTTDPNLRSWVASANAELCDFPIQNLPFGVFRRLASEGYRGGIAIGTEIFDLQEGLRLGLFQGNARDAARAAAGDALNALMAQGALSRRNLRLAVSGLLREGAARREDVAKCLVPQASAEMALPARISGFSDFYASFAHAQNVGRLFRPDNPVLPNFEWLPAGYHGRTSSIRPSGHPVTRPHGQIKRSGSHTPVFGPCEKLDYEAEMGFLVGAGNELGEPVSVDAAESHLFGMVIYNDWSARDIQSWEYQPLGPFLGKSFLSSISPWVVTLEALAPFRCGLQRPLGHAEPLPHLHDKNFKTSGAYSLKLEVRLKTSQMKVDGHPGDIISCSQMQDMYWSIRQILAHQTSSGCNLQPGDLLGTGTLSGADEETQGCLLERTKGGHSPLVLSTGETRDFLRDGDTVIMRAFCESPGAVRIGFGECVGTVQSRTQSSLGR